jgi:hypothetical protein
MKPRKDDLIQPPHLTREQWLVSLQSDRRDMLAQIKRQVHTSRSDGGCYRYIDRLDRAIKSLDQSV